MAADFAYAPPPEKRGYVITLFCDDPDAWIMPWIERLASILSPFHTVRVCTKASDIETSDFAFLLGCTRILPEAALSRSRENLVIHESELPLGRGWSPVSWQVAEGQNRIPVTLFRAVAEMDAGPVFLRDAIELDGTELLPEIKAKQGIKTVEMALEFLLAWPDLPPRPQTGSPTFYERRGEADDRLDPEKSIAEQFDRLRIAHNDAYPAWFEHRGRRYVIKIYPKD